MDVRRNLAVVASCFFSALFLLSGYVQAGETPEGTVGDYLTALESGGIASSINYLHSNELLRFKDMMLPIFEPGISENHSELVTSFFGSTATLEEVREKHPAEFTRAFLVGADDQMRSIGMSFGPSKVIGSVTEGPVVHVVTRVTSGTAQLSFSQLEVISVTLEGDDWKLMLTGGIEGLAKVARARAGLN